MFPTVYTNKGVSRFDKHWQCHRCCHCDGLAYLSPLERYLAENDHGEEANYVQTMVEAGEAHDLGFRQYLHYRCGCYAGPNRQFLAEDLDTLAGTVTLDDATVDTLLAHYPPDTFNVGEVRLAWQRVHVTAADFAEFRRRDRNNLSLPARNDPRVVLTLDYNNTRWQRQPECDRCAANVEAQWPGLAFFRGGGDVEPHYMHYDCYNIIAEKRERDRQERMLGLFSDTDRWRLEALIRAWGRVPIQEFMEWESHITEEPHTAAYEKRCAEFLAFYEQRIGVSS